MRLIDADALIKFIDNRYDITWKDDYEGGIKDACTDTLEEINKMPTIEPQQWIPCSERPPEHDGEKYLVTLYSDRINVVSVRISYCYMNRDGFWSDVPVGYKVTAWMPLPEPYNGEREGTE